jgi:OmpA-OmpF porin, OOP family
MKIEIGGYTDNVGDESLNKNLSEKRAKAVYDYFVGQGIDESRMVYAGYGSKNPIAENTTTEGQKKNRRIEIKILKK